MCSAIKLYTSIKLSYNHIIIYYVVMVVTGHSPNWQLVKIDWYSVVKAHQGTPTPIWCGVSTV
jgi:hypothetical protein